MREGEREKEKGREREWGGMKGGMKEKEQRVKIRGRQKERGGRKRKSWEKKEPGIGRVRERGGIVKEWDRQLLETRKGEKSKDRKAKKYRGNLSVKNALKSDLKQLEATFDRRIEN